MQKENKFRSLKTKLGFENDSVLTEKELLFITGGTATVALAGGSQTSGSASANPKSVNCCDNTCVCTCTPKPSPTDTIPVPVPSGPVAK